MGAHRSGVEREKPSSTTNIQNAATFKRDRAEQSSEVSH